MREAFDSYRRALGDEHTDTILAAGNLGDLETSRGRYADAEALLLRAVEAVRRTLPREHVYTGLTLRKYGRLLTSTRRFVESEKALLEAEKILSASAGPDHAQTKAAVQNLVELYDAWEHPEQARVWRKRLG